MTEMYTLVLHVHILAVEVNLLTLVDLKRTVWDILGHMGVSYEIDLLESVIWFLTIQRRTSVNTLVVVQRHSEHVL